MPTDAELRALRKVKAAFERYFVHYSAEHDDDCPGDDTCECPMVLGVEEAFREFESLLRPQEPEHAARERLGRWLTADLGKRTAHVDEPGPLLDRFHCQLFDGIGYRIESFEGDGATKDEAINAALDAAERGRT